jgi:hypothetical protein
MQSYRKLLGLAKARNWVLLCVRNSAQLATKLFFQLLTHNRNVSLYYSADFKQMTFNSLRFVVLPSPTYSQQVSRLFIFTWSHSDTHTRVGRTPLDEGSARRRDLYLTTQTLYKRQTSMPPVGFEPTIPASARPHTYALDRAATGIGQMTFNKNVKVQRNLHLSFFLHVLNN